MSLRTRLLLAVGGLVTVALVVSGIFVVGITRQSLVDRLDNQLLSANPGDVVQPGPGRGSLDPAGRRFAIFLVDSTGEILGYAPSGFQRDPDPIPVLGTPDTAQLPRGRIVDAASADGSLHYRVRTIQWNSSTYLVLAAPMRDVEQATAFILRALVVVGIIVLVLALVAGWLLIRRDLRPLEEVTATATRITAGDLSQRVGMGERTSEVGRLGDAFDSMLDQIQGAFQSQQQALTAKDRSERQLRRFIADASHELRTPLTVLRGYTDLYRAGGLEERETLEQAMLRIGTESRRMTELVEDLLLLARLDQGRPLERETVSMTDLVGDAVHDAQAIEPDRPINAQVADDVTVQGDADRLRQVVGNLLANVRVHTSSATPVDVRLAALDGRCTFTVADHGRGVDPAHVAHIFDRFYRADAGRSRDRGGSGLGLAIAASVVEAHGGTIVYSDTPGGGATFTVDLPRTPEPGRA